MIVGELSNTLTAERSAATHTQGHTYYGSTCPQDCANASRWAARRLITPRLFLAAAQQEDRIEQVAVRLSVTTADVVTYIGTLTTDEYAIMRRLVGHPLT